MIRKLQLGLVAMGTVALMGVAPAQAGPPKDAPTKCAPDAVLVGSSCLDTYEASVWRIPDPFGANKGLVKKVRKGKATVADLTAGGATQLGTIMDDYAPCLDAGQACKDDIYAVSLAGVTPAGSITWFQSNLACANSGKRLPTNAEWQMAVTGSPDPGPDNGTTDCNTGVSGTVPTGSRSSCVSAFGAYDMVGNCAEWVADWGPRSVGCGSWANSDDNQCLAGAAATAGEPGALVRGGHIFSFNAAGPLWIANNEPSFESIASGFRCSR